MAPQKRICFTGRACSLAKCAGTSCWKTECSATVPEMNSSTKERKSNMNHKQLLFWLRELYTESSDSEHHHGQNSKTTGSPEARGGSQETRKNKGTKEEDGKIPQYSSRSCSWSQILFFRTRSIRNPDTSFCWEPVTYFLIVFCPRSPCSWPLHCCCFRLHNALDRCAAAALFKDHVAYFFSVIVHISLCIFFKSSPFFPVIGNIDPSIVVLTLSFKSSFFLSWKFCLRKSLMSYSHLFFGLPIVLLVLYLQLRVPFSSFF